MPEKWIPHKTKTDKGKFPKGTEHEFIQDPYGVGYEGRVHIYRRPGESWKGHADLFFSSVIKRPQVRKSPY